MLTSRKDFFNNTLILLKKNLNLIDTELGIDIVAAIMLPYHVGFIDSKSPLFLQKLGNDHFQWADTECTGETAADAIAAAYKMWPSFCLLRCGMLYTLPQRDEVGQSAFFHQMAKSYASSNGHYFDEELGSMCYVDFASTQALDLWREIR